MPKQSKTFTDKYGKQFLAEITLLDSSSVACDVTMKGFNYFASLAALSDTGTVTNHNETASYIVPRETIEAIETWATKKGW